MLNRPVARHSWGGRSRRREGTLHPECSGTLHPECPGRGCLAGAVPLHSHPQKILWPFHLKWLILVQIALYFNRNVRQFTATIYCIYCWRLSVCVWGGEFHRSSLPLPLTTGRLLAVVISWYMIRIILRWHRLLHKLVNDCSRLLLMGSSPSEMTTTAHGRIPSTRFHQRTNIAPKFPSRTSHMTHHIWKATLEADHNKLQAPFKTEFK